MGVILACFVFVFGVQVRGRGRGNGGPWMALHFRCSGASTASSDEIVSIYY